MSSPENVGEYVPAQEELGLVFRGLQHALMSNSRLFVDTYQIIADGIPRTFRETSIADTMTSHILQGNDSYDEIDVVTRTSSADKWDVNWVKVELRNYTKAGLRRNLQYILKEDVSYHESTLGQLVYHASKTLPMPNSVRTLNHNINNTVTQEESSTQHIERQTRSITPEDMTLLGRLITSLSE